MITVVASGYDPPEGYDYHFIGVYFHGKLEKINKYDIPFTTSFEEYQNIPEGVHDVVVELHDSETMEFICNINATLYLWKYKDDGFNNRGFIVLPDDVAANEYAMAKMGEGSEWL